MSLILQASLASGSSEFTRLIEENLIKNLTSAEREALENMASQVSQLVIDPILNYKGRDTYRIFNERVSVFSSYLLAMNTIIISNYFEKSGITGIEVLEHEESSTINVMLKTIRAGRKKLGPTETSALLNAVKAVWEHDSLILSNYVQNPRTTEQAIFSLDLYDLQQAVSKACLTILLPFVVIIEEKHSHVRLQNAKRIALMAREICKDLEGYTETLDILINPTSVKLEAMSEEDLHKQRFSGIEELAKGR